MAGTGRAVVTALRGLVWLIAECVARCICWEETAPDAQDYSDPIDDAAPTSVKKLRLWPGFFGELWPWKCLQVKSAEDFSVAGRVEYFEGPECDLFEVGTVIEEYRILALAGSQIHLMTDAENIIKGEFRHCEFRDANLLADDSA